MFVLLSASPNTAAAFDTMRCGSRLVSVGETKATVLLRCGEPLFREEVGERTVGRIRGKIKEEDKDKKDEEKKFFVGRAETTVKVEEWIYQESRYRFPRILTFEGSRLVKIELGDKP